jgi:hypothetical protein
MYQPELPFPPIYDIKVVENTKFVDGTTLLKLSGVPESLRDFTHQVFNCITRGHVEFI